MKLFCVYIAFLRTLYIVHQNNHWTCQGNDFYGNHLLFEKIYKTAQENADMAAEKFVGLYGSNSLLLTEQAKYLNSILTEFSVGDDLIDLSLKLEKAFQEISKKLYKELESSNQLTLGVDDMIMSIANTREEAIYLLKQAKN
jgi:DNA-binding ferritin-like protein